MVRLFRCLCALVTFTGGGPNQKCEDALYCLSMPRTGSESSATAFLQRTLRGGGGNPVVEVRKVTHCGTPQQSLVLLEAMRSSANDG